TSARTAPGRVLRQRFRFPGWPPARAECLRGQRGALRALRYRSWHARLACPGTQTARAPGIYFTTVITDVFYNVRLTSFHAACETRPTPPPQPDSADPISRRPACERPP